MKLNNSMLLSRFQPMSVGHVVDVPLAMPPTRSHVTLIVAPAGFGKSTLAARLIENQQERSVWLTLDEHDNDLAQFVLYVVKAVQQLEPTVGQDALNALYTDAPPSPETLATLLINSTVAMQQGLTLVLDDYHLINNPDVHQFMIVTIANAINGFRFIVTSRHDPHFPARWRARGWIHEIRTDNLRFSNQMAATYLNQQMNLNLTSDEIETLVRRTEGWISGLQLAALALLSAPDRSQFVTIFGGSQRFVIDYLMEEVLEQQPDHLQVFLRQTAILNRMSADLCEAVTGRTDSAHILKHLHDHNLFIVALGRGWFRYHQLFADVLQLSLSADEQTELHQRAGDWLRGEGLIEEAVSHYIRANALEIAATCVADLVIASIGIGDHLRLKHLLSLLPETAHTLRPELLLARSWFATHAYQLDSATALLNQINTDDAELQAWISAIRALIAYSRGEMTAILSHIEAARPYSQSPELTGMYDWLSGVALWEQGQPQPAIERIRTALRSPSVYNDPFGYSGISYFLSDYLNQMGRRQEALAVCERLMDELVDADDNLLAHVAPIVAQAGILHYEANELDTAAYLLNTNMHLSQPLNLTPAMVIGRVYLALIGYAHDNKEAAYRMLHDARHITNRTESHPFSLTVDAVENWLHMRDGNPDRMTHWLKELPLTPPRLPFTVCLIALRGLIHTQGENAMPLLQTLEATARQAGHDRRLIPLFILRALHHDRQTDHEAAFVALREAVRLAAVSNYQRDFLDEPPRVLDMLSRIRDVSPGFIDSLIQRAPQPFNVQQPLIDPLTERELEVIELAARGYSNREIAAEMFVAVSTIKTHIKHAFSKLDAEGSRTRAIARARELGLLQNT